MTTRQRTSDDPFRSFATNSASKFQEWRLHLANGATLTGIAYFPQSQSHSTHGPRPLIVGIHGATCCAYNYDPSPAYTVSRYCDDSGLPFVAFNRPNFLDSSGWIVDRSENGPTQPQYKPRQGLAYFEEEARWYHEYIIPVIWKHFAVPNSCTSLVTTSHSMSVPITIIASTLYTVAQRRGQHSYLWAGMVLSGFAEDRTQHSIEVSNALATNTYDGHELPLHQDVATHLPPYRKDDKIELMLGPDGISEAHLRPLVWQQTTPFLQHEIIDMVGMWPNRKTEIMSAVEMPVLYGIGEHDWIWQGTQENVDAFCSQFGPLASVQSWRVDAASHAIEWSRVGSVWWEKVFAWALQQSRAATSGAALKPVA